MNEHVNQEFKLCKKNDKKFIKWKKLKAIPLWCIWCRYAFVVSLPPSSMVAKEFGISKPTKIHHISCIDPLHILAKYTYYNVQNDIQHTNHDKHACKKHI